jgi:hypothetical protein
LPDGLFLNQKSQSGSISGVLRLENVGMFYGHFEYFTDIWDIFSGFGIMYQEKSGNTGNKPVFKNGIKGSSSAKFVQQT